MQSMNIYTVNLVAAGVAVLLQLFLHCSVSRLKFSLSEFRMTSLFVFSATLASIFILVFKKNSLSSYHIYDNFFLYYEV
jgi:hypothetical protein